MSFFSLKNLVRRKRINGTLGLELRPDGIAWALCSGSASWQAGFDECSPAQREKTLKSRIQALSPGRCHVRAVLPIDQYQVFQVERPPVESSEVAAAVRWTLKGLLDFPVDDAVVDVFDVPKDASRGRGSQVNVVVARKTLIQDLAIFLGSVDLELMEVDVAELAMRNFLNVVKQESRSSALVYLRRQYGHLVVCQGNTLYMSRRVDVRAEQLQDAATQEQAVMSLGLELQRSFDYYESQLGQVPPRKVHIIGHNQALPLEGLLSGVLAAQVVSLPVADTLELAQLDPRSLYAIGTAAQPTETQA